MTSRAGLIAVGELMDSLNLSERTDKYFPLPKSNRGFLPSEVLKTFILMQHEGSFHLDEVRHIKDDEALRTVLNLKKRLCATTLGDWLRRMGSQPQIEDAWTKVNQGILPSALYHCKKITLDIDATEVVAHKSDATNRLGDTHPTIWFCFESKPSLSHALP
ncbi:MAG: hypothetical protein ACI9CE_000423 [Flavobacterium sp.]